MFSSAFIALSELLPLQAARATQPATAASVILDFIMLSPAL